MADIHTRNDDPDRRVPDDNPRIAPLHDVGDFQVADGYPDPRGWDVLAADGRKVGKVHDLIVDTGQLRTRYLDVSLDKHAIGASDDRDVLIPVGAAQLDDSADHVLLGGVSTAQLASIPEFHHDRITREYENSVLDRIPMTGTASVPADEYYATQHFDDRRFYANRSSRETRTDAARMDAARNNADRATSATASRDLDRHDDHQRDERRDDRHDDAADQTRVTRSEEDLDVEKRQVRAGEVEVRKHVDTEHVSKPVTLRHEEVTIERRPLSADRASGDLKIGDDNEVRIPITEEQLVVEKRVVPKEEIVITKHVVSKEQTVDADVRKERVDVDRSHEHDAPPEVEQRADNRTDQRVDDR